ncbi:TetR/AcrR family transcriptional regulator [Planococcus dechangensis]|uniref:TetR/AcrR family transcriptional regulator n=1 Tax=Planococcus dechangensis TaxID=1176255 RepID=A0ABV9MAV1_9BACL
MGRKRKINKLELFQSTEKLLLIYGYDQFHFKILAKELNVARSTVYDYFANKEELVTEYMCDLMGRVNLELIKLKPIQSPLDRLKRMLKVFFTFSHIHNVLQIAHVINRGTSEKVEQNMQKLDNYHHEFFGMIISWIQEGQEKGELRPEISSSIIAGLFFTSIQIPNMENLKPDEWREAIFQAICEGIIQKNS